MDLNRNWDQPADPALAPENAALEKWLETLVAQGKRPDLAIDFHNDAGGNLHVSRPEIGPTSFRSTSPAWNGSNSSCEQKTWFTEGSTKSSFRNPGTIGEGLLARYGIAACIHELNANHIAGLDDYPTAEHWKQYGQQLADVFCEYFGSE